MSGSRTANQELVYCHACQNEFYKERDNIDCPECHSDFTEVVDPTFDPREGQEEDSLHDRSAWGHDPDEADIEELSHVPTSTSNSGWRSSSLPRQDFVRDDPFGSPFQTPLFENFSTMLNGMTGRSLNRGYPSGYNGGPPIFHPQPSGISPTPPAGSFTYPQPFGGRPRPVSDDWPRQGGTQIHTRTFPGGNGGIHISFTTSSGWRTSNTQGGELNDINDFFRAVLQGPQGPPGPGRGGPHGQAMSPLAAIFSSILNPANAQHGDAVFSQEAFDRVMSQLMEQHTSGTAPGPASEAAIAALPRKKVSEDMLDEDTHQAECTICMENVSVGEEVTVLPCQHWFHHPCVEAWLKEHDTCPICRSGIVPKEGDPNTPRTPQQAPLHDNDPFLLARQQSGSRENPFVVPESPTQERRRPNTRRYSSEQSGTRRRSENEGSSSFTGRVRSFFSGGGNGGDSSRR